MGLDNWQWAVAALSAVMIGMSKTGLPGVGILCVPLMASIMPAKASTGIVLPMLIFADVFAVAYYHRHAVWPHLFRLMPWATGGDHHRVFYHGRINDAQLKPVIGVIVLVMLGLHYVRDRINGDNATCADAVVVCGDAGTCRGHYDDACQCGRADHDHLSFGDAAAEK